MGTLVSVELTRGELVALKETIELTPLFEGRSGARDAIRAMLRSRKPPSSLSLDEETATSLVRNVVVPVDLMSANIHSKLSRAIERQRVLQWFPFMTARGTSKEPPLVLAGGPTLIRVTTAARVGSTSRDAGRPGSRRGVAPRFAASRRGALACSATTGLDLAAETGADPQIVFAFGLFHDTRRENESHDPGHGPRAAVFARELHRDGDLLLDAERLELLCLALELHADGQVSAHPTVGTCWDADRLHLGRLGPAFPPGSGPAIDGGREDRPTPRRQRSHDASSR